MQKGKFIVLEGIDGCGKTTIANLIAEHVSNVWITHEPTRETPAGRKIQAILQHKRPAPDSLTMQRLYIKDRQAHTKKIKAALAKGTTVIAQRYALSTFAYGTAFGVPEKDLEHDFLKPDVTILLDLPADLAMRRIATRKQGREYFEKREKLAKIRKQYLKLASAGGGSAFAGKITIVDAKPKPEVIVKKILWHIK